VGRGQEEEQELEGFEEKHALGLVGLGGSQEEEADGQRGRS
jgi:hypothetical protein